MLNEPATRHGHVTHPTSHAHVTLSCDTFNKSCDAFAHLQHCDDLHLQLALAGTMGKKPWASPEQLQWLYSQLPGFLKAQEAKTTATFLSAAYTQFHEQWPVAPPTPPEIAAAEEGQEQAMSIKIKASEAVSLHITLVYVAIQLLIFTCQRIKDWIYNHRRASNSGTGTRGILKLGGAPRVLHPWQAFHKLFYEDLKPTIDTEWQEFQQVSPASTMTLFQFRNNKMQTWYEESTPEVKEQVEEYRQKCKDGLAEADEDDDPNQEFQQ
jgi:hypothetical protein